MGDRQADIRSLSPYAESHRLCSFCACSLLHILFVFTCVLGEVAQAFSGLDCKVTVGHCPWGECPCAGMALGWRWELFSLVQVLTRRKAGFWRFIRDCQAAFLSPEGMARLYTIRLPGRCMWASTVVKTCLSRVMSLLLLFLFYYY